MKKAKERTDKFSFSNPLVMFGLCLLAVILAYLTGSRAIDTGSWWEYGYTGALLIYALNRFITAINSLRLKKS